MESYLNLKKISDKNNEIEFRAEVPPEMVQEHEKRELQHLGKDVSFPGFRKGKLPENILRGRINPTRLLEETAESAVRVAIRDIAEEKALDVIGIPKVDLETLEPNKPIVFTVRFAIAPKVELPDYKAIGKEIFSQKNDVNVSDEEIDEAMLELRRMAMRVTGEKELPELNDAFAEKFGGAKTFAALKDEVKNELVRGKEKNLRDARRNEAIKAVAQKSKLTIPELLVEQELTRFLESRDAALERLGMTQESYLKEAKKTEKELAKEDRAAIEDRIRISLIFREIQEAENIAAAEHEIATGIDALKSRYPNEDLRNLRRSAEAAIIEEKVFKVLEPLA
jgi:FKBP-type peptidyl-prolyl cis-trans isomerase (trigger factor)